MSPFSLSFSLHLYLSIGKTRVRDNFKSSKENKNSTKKATKKKRKKIFFSSFFFFFFLTFLLSFINNHLIWTHLNIRTGQKNTVLMWILDFSRGDNFNYSTIEACINLGILLEEEIKSRIYEVYTGCSLNIVFFFRIF